MSWFSQFYDNVIPNEIKFGGGGGKISDNYIVQAVSGKDSKPADSGLAPGGGAPKYDETLLAAFNAQRAIQPALIAGMREFQPQYLDIQKEAQTATARNQMDLMAELYQKSAPIEAAYQNALRQNQLQSLQTTLPQYQQVLNSLTPGYAQAVTNMGQLAQQATQSATQPVRLTNYEAQVAGPYGPAQASMRAGSPAQLGTAQAINQYGPPQVSAVGGPRIMTGQMQGPALPSELQPQVSMRAPLEANQVQPQGLQQAVAGQYAAGIPQLQTTAPLTQLGQTAAQAAAQAGQVPNAVNMRMVPSAFSAARTAGEVPSAVNMGAIAGPQLQSGLENINRGTVDQYVATMPGMSDYAKRLSQISQQELAAGRSLTAEEQRMADQVARSAYAARGTALGPQAVNYEILNRADVANQRFQERLGTAQRAAQGIQGVYQPALEQSLSRQLSGLQYGLSAQGQAFGQAQNRDAMEQALQAQRYSQAMGTQSTGFGQAQARDTMAQAIQAQRYNQAMGAQGTGFTQLLGQENLLQEAQQQAFNQAMGREALLSSTQGAAFNQAIQRNQAEQQRLQNETAIQAGKAQLGAGALGQLQAAQAPVMAAYNQQPLLQQTVGQAQQMGLLNQQAAGNSLFQPESSMAFQSAFLPYQGNIALQQAQLQANAAKQAGQMQMLGSLGSAGIGAMAMAFCWVAREVYGTQTGTWKVFRSWMLEEAPKWLRSAYIEHGPKIANFIKDKPVLKAIIRKWMDSKIETYLTA